MKDSLAMLLQNYEPGLPMTAAAMARLGIRREAVARFVKRGCIKRIGHGAYSLPKDGITGAGVAAVLMREMPDVYLGSTSALLYHGIYHNVHVDPPMVLFGKKRRSLPSWTKAFPLFYWRQSLFDFSTEAGRRLDSQTVKPCLVAPFSLRCSVPERAVLEMMFEVGRGFTEDDAYNIMTGVISLRKELLGPLLQACKSIKTTRLFLSLMDHAGMLEFSSEQLVEEFSLNIGRRPLNKRKVYVV